MFFFNLLSKFYHLKHFFLVIIRLKHSLPRSWDVADGHAVILLLALPALGRVGPVVVLVLLRGGGGGGAAGAGLRLGRLAGAGPGKGAVKRNITIM